MGYNTVTGRGLRNVEGRRARQILMGAEMLDWREHLWQDPIVCHGQLCAKGTRVLVTNILDSLAEGATRDEIIASYPSIRVEHIDAAIAYAAELAREESLLPLLN